VRAESSNRQGALRRALKRGAALATRTGIAVIAAAAAPAVAFAQSTAPAGGIGAQLNSISSEAINSGGQAGGMAMYVAAIVCFVGGAWALWSSRHEQNRGGGKVGMGIAGLVLAGLFATGPTWIGKAAVTTSGGAASITNTPTTIQFGQ
jgi:hypothetical protein